MRWKDFDIGAPFFTATGTWVCTDKGARVICAIKVDEHDISWLSGPPYMVPETVFDENDQLGCWLDDAQEMSERWKACPVESEPLIPHEVALEGLRIRMSPETRAYPYQRLLKIARLRDGAALHPQGAERNGSEWLIVARTAEHAFVRIPDGEFRSLPCVPISSPFPGSDRQPI